MFSESKTKKYETEEKIWEGKGIVENLFHLLWTKDPVFGTIPSLSIPDTIIFRYDEPIFWYFMNGNMIKKKNKEKLNNKYIENSFLKNVPECGVVAQYFYKISDEEKENQKENENENTKVIFEYFNVEEFIIIKTTWGPNLCVFEKKECIKKIGDLKYDLYERIFTYEAEDYHSRIVPLRGYILPNKIEKLSYIIVQHVSNVSFERLQIERMVLNFKVDSQNKIWLLYCSFLQLKNTSPFYKLTQIISKIIYDFDVEEGVPKNINTHMASIIRPLNLRKSFYCYNCCQNIDSHRILEVSYKTIIDSYEFDHQEHLNINLEAENKKRVLDLKSPLRNFGENQSINYLSKNITIPPIIKNINPKLKEKEYVILKKDPNFLHKITSVCEECFLIIAKGNIAGGDYNIQRVRTNESTKLFGTGRLRPEALNYRNKLTLRNIKYKTLIEDLRPDIKPQIIDHLMSPTKIFSANKLFENESQSNSKPKNDLATNLYENMIELPLRGSIRGSIRSVISNQKNQENNKIDENNHQNRINFFVPASQNEELVKKTLENVKEINDGTFSDDDDSLNDSNENEKDDKNENNSRKIIEKFTKGLDLIDNSKEKTEEKKEIDLQNAEKYSQNSNSLTERNSKLLAASENLRKVFVPNLKNTTNSFSRLFVPPKLIPTKQTSYLASKETSKKLKNQDSNRIFDDSTKTHINTFHSRNASLPSLNSPPIYDFLTKNKENDLKKTFIESPNENFIIPKNIYFNKILDTKNIVNPGMKKLKETLDLNCYVHKKTKKTFFF